MLAQQLVGYHNGPQDPAKYDEKPTNIVFAKNGTFRVVKTATALFKAQVGEYKTPSVDVPGLEAMTAGAELLIPKIPFKYLNMILSFYRDVNTQDRTEASVLFFWNKDNIELPETYEGGEPIKGLLTDGQLVIYCPKQVNSGTLSEFHQDTMVPWLRENMALLCETHSHNTMNAFFSGTDDANENATQFYGVWGKVADAEPMFAFRYVCGDKKEQISPDTLFDWPVVTETTRVTKSVPGMEDVVTETSTEALFKGPFPHEDYPADWMEQHSKKTYVPATTPYKGRSKGGYSGYYPESGYYGAGNYGAQGLPAYDDEAGWAEYYRSRNANDGASGQSRAQHLAGVDGGKKEVKNLGEGVKEKGIAGADVLEIHTQLDVINMPAVEKEAEDICEELRDYGKDNIIESSIRAAQEHKTGKDTGTVINPDVH